MLISYRLRVKYVPGNDRAAEIQNKLEEMGVFGKYIDRFDEGGVQTDKCYGYMCFGDYEMSEKLKEWDTVFDDLKALSKAFPKQIFVWEHMVHNEKFKGWAGIFFKDGMYEPRSGYTPDIFEWENGEADRKVLFADEASWAYDMNLDLDPLPPRKQSNIVVETDDSEFDFNLT